MTSDLHALVAAELAAPVGEEVRAFAARLAAGARRPPLAILFYGSALRTGDLDGILDFYAVVDRPADWPQGPVAAFGNRLLPPNVEYHEATIGGARLRAKVAILSLRQFRRLARPETLDNSVWARFSQPAAVPWARDERAREAMVAAVAGAVATAVRWSVRLGPREAAPADFWRGLFRRTYASELRVEKADRSDSIVAHDPERYRRMLIAACAAISIEWKASGEGLVLIVSEAGRQTGAERGWRRRARLARPLNLARLAKAAFTFKGGSDYLAWKVARHTGAEILLTERQRRHPLLAFGAITWTLWRRRRASG